MDIRTQLAKSYIHLIPPPPPSLYKLPEEEIKEVTDYISEHAKQTYRLLKNDANRHNENWKGRFVGLAAASFVVITFLLVIILIIVSTILPHPPTYAASGTSTEWMADGIHTSGQGKACPQTGRPERRPLRTIVTAQHSGRSENRRQRYEKIITPQNPSRTKCIVTKANSRHEQA